MTAQAAPQTGPAGAAAAAEDGRRRRANRPAPIAPAVEELIALRLRLNADLAADRARAGRMDAGADAGAVQGPRGRRVRPP